MRLIITLFACLSYSAAAQELNLTSLVEEASGNTAPPVVQRAIANAVAADLQNCQKQLAISDEQTTTYFSAKPIDLNDDLFQDYIVYPSLRCFAFFGAHSTAFWLLLGQPNDQPPNLVFEGRHDAIELLESKSNGLRDFDLIYGYDSWLVRYNGTTYEAGEVIRNVP